MKSFIYLLFSILILLVGCKKHENDTKTETDESNYDVVNRIFRINITSTNGIPYNVTIKQGSPDANVTGAFDIQQVQQNTGAAFNYYFTPVIGKLINVQVQSNTNNPSLIKCFIFYKGSQTWKVDLKAAPGGGSVGEFSYVIEN